MTNKYADHVESICALNNIVIGSHSRGGRSYRQLRRIDIRPVKTAITYAVALHEIGHILGPDQTKSRLEKEGGAWVWAQANALEWTEPMQKTMVKCLRSYKNWLARHKTLKTPPADHAFWRLQS